MSEAHNSAIDAAWLMAEIARIDESNVTLDRYRDGIVAAGLSPQYAAISWRSGAFAREVGRTAEEALTALLAQVVARDLDRRDREKQATRSGGVRSAAPTPFRQEPKHGRQTEERASEQETEGGETDSREPD